GCPRAPDQRPDGVEDGDVHPFCHARQDVRALVGRDREGLVGVDADRHLVPPHRGLEHADARRARCVIDDVGAAVVLGQGQFLAFDGILERLPGGARVIGVDGHLGVDVLGARRVAGLKPLDQRDLHAPTKPALLVFVYMPARAPTRKDPSCSLKSRHATFGAGVSGQPSTMANLAAGKSFATLVMASVKRNPTPMMRSYLPSPSSRTSSSRFCPPAVGSRYLLAIRAPNVLAARSRPAYAISLNERSPRPPTSNTRPTRAALA